MTMVVKAEEEERDGNSEGGAVRLSSRVRW
jgi:hypothetical protein